jgi:hypothetical protein
VLAKIFDIGREVSTFNEHFLVRGYGAVIERTKCVPERIAARIDLLSRSQDAVESGVKADGGDDR